MLTLFLMIFAPFWYQPETIQEPLLEKSSITYHLKHKLHEWDGVSDKLKIQAIWDKSISNNKITKIAVLTKVSSFNSGLSNRDSHMIEVLDALTYPNIIFTSTSISYNQNDILVKGQLQFHGVTQQITFNAKQLFLDDDLIFEGSFPVLLEDYKVKRPSLLFVKAENEIQIKFKIYFK
jgi:polyisoprenoid-binding protein YceI